MALMKYREGNQVKWVGVRPGHRGEQVTGRQSAIGVANDVYEVPANKVLCLTFIHFSSNNSAGNVNAYIGWVNAGDVLQALFVRHEYDGAGQLSDTLSLHEPIEIPAGHKIIVESSNATIDCYGSIFGRIEKA